MKVMKHADWLAEAQRRFGQKARHWKFVCPACKTVQEVKEYLDAGLSQEQVHGVIGYSCIGRFVKGRGCDWTLGGLLRIHELEVEFEDGKRRECFEFAEADPHVEVGA